MKNISLILFCSLFFSCSTEDKLGKHHSHKKQKEVDEKSDFHQKQAKEIIDDNLKNKEENKNHSEKRRLEHVENLEKLNNTEIEGKKTVPKRPDYNFY